MLDYNTLVELVERIHKNIGVGSTVVLKGETSDIRNLSKSTINKLKCGDIVVKKTGNQKHAYIVTYKEEKQGICLTYLDADCIETVSYDYTNGNWVYNSTDITSMAVLKAKQDALVSGENIKTVNGQSILGSGNVNLESVIYSHKILISGNLVSSSASYAFYVTIITSNNEPINDLTKLSSKIGTYAIAPLASNNFVIGGSQRAPIAINCNGTRTTIIYASSSTYVGSTENNFIENIFNNLTYTDTVTQI